MDQPVNDAQFANFFLDPTLARVVNALTDGVVAIPTPPRTDLLPVGDVPGRMSRHAGRVSHGSGRTNRRPAGPASSAPAVPSISCAR